MNMKPRHENVNDKNPAPLGLVGMFAPAGQWIALNFLTRLT